MTYKITLDTTIIASRNQVFADLGIEAVILNLNSGAYYELNAVGSRL